MVRADLWADLAVLGSIPAQGGNLFDPKRDAVSKWHFSFGSSWLIYAFFVALSFSDILSVMLRQTLTLK